MTVPLKTGKINDYVLCLIFPKSAAAYDSNTVCVATSACQAIFFHATLIRPDP